EAGAFVVHREEGLGKVLGPAADPDWGDVSVEFQDKVEDVFAAEISLHRRPLMTLAQKKNFLARAKRLGKLLCQNMCSCGCEEVCAKPVCVCGGRGTPYHDDGRYCCACAEELGLDLGKFANSDEHLHAGHDHCGCSHTQNDSDSEFEL
ncbi:CIPK25, partial [Symbiodinium pilosum]